MITNVYYCPPCGGNCHLVQAGCQKGKVTLEMFFEWHGTVHNKFIAESTVVYRKKYKEVLTCLWEAVCLKLCDVWTAKDLVFLHIIGQVR
jgi:hypothetical protein